MNMARRVALISDHASPLTVLGGVDSGGQNVYVGQIARHLADAGWAVDVFTRRDSPQLPQIAEWVDGVRIIHVPAGPARYVPKEQLLAHMEEFTRYVVAFCRKQRTSYDLVHANFFMSGLVAMELRRELGIPFVVTFHALGRVRRMHQGTADAFPPERIEIEDRIVAEADRLIAECPQDEEDLIRLYNADAAKITIIPCGFDPVELSPISKPLARVVLGLPPEENVILHVGRLVPRKGIETLVRGFAQFRRDEQRDTRLLIVGGESDQPDPALTPEIGRLQRIAEEEGVSDHVQFMGRCGRDKLKYYYSAADVFVTTPWYEPFGITPLEAMACGTPVIGSNVGGIKFSVRDNETGYLVPANAPEALAERLARMYQHPKLRKQLGRQALQRVNDLFTWRKVADGIGTLYEEVLAARDPARRSAIGRFALLDRGFEDAVNAAREARSTLRPAMLEAADRIAECFAMGGKLLICGNGGSAADAQHFATELVGRFKRPERKALPAIALTADTALLTAWSNDVGYEEVFARQVEAFAGPRDVLIGISTSGRSRNSVRAFEAARRLGALRIGILGGDGGDLRARSDIALIVPSTDTQRIQEVQILLIHLLCELIEEQVAGQPSVAEIGASMWDQIESPRADEWLVGRPQ